LADERLGILFVCGDSVEPWNPEIAAQQGIGGSETAVIEIAKRLAAKGHRVRVFCNCGTAGLFDDVEYTNDLRDIDEAHVMIAWRDAALLEGIPAQVKLVWAHDTTIANATRWTLHLADRVVAVSTWHRDHLVERYSDSCGLKSEKVVVLRNGIEPSRFQDSTPRNHRRAIYSSSPDRGLDQLLDMWPRIRERVPAAELHVFYGSKLLRMVAQDWARSLHEKMAATAGVFDRGRVNQTTLAHEMMMSGVWLFPSWQLDKPWTETSCIGAMESQAAGLHIVTSPHGALTETVLTGAFVDGDARTREYQDRFVELAVERMGWVDEEYRMRIRRDAIKAFGWDDVADRWDGMLRTLAMGKERAA
jgi:glycosyltransferase involved in cell wall biosynthesis